MLVVVCVWVTGSGGEGVNNKKWVISWERWFSISHWAKQVLTPRVNLEC